jgi:hypothetical protein
LRSPYLILCFYKIQGKENYGIRVEAVAFQLFVGQFAVRDDLLPLVRLFGKDGTGLIFDDLVFLRGIGRDDDLGGLGDALSGGVEKLGVAANEGLLHRVR